LLNTVSLLKSEFTKDTIKLKKLTKTKTNCRNVNGIILLSKISEFLKFIIEKKTIKKERQSPKYKE
tara:strand:+ start:16 stop:213 length:198 start_codon:yes stop_codon:yes gene_type:complete